MALCSIEAAYGVLFLYFQSTAISSEMISRDWCACPSRSYTAPNQAHRKAIRPTANVFLFSCAGQLLRVPSSASWLCSFGAANKYVLTDGGVPSLLNLCGIYLCVVYCLAMLLTP